MNEDETSIVCTFFPIYEVLTAHSILFCVGTGAHHSCIKDSVLERIVRHFGRLSITVIYSKSDFKFDDTLVTSRGIAELMLLTSGSTLDIPINFHVIGVEIPPLLGLDLLGGNNFLVKKVTNHLWNRIVTNKDPL